MKYAFTLFLMLVFCTSCGGQNKPGLPKEKEQPKLVKSPGNGNLQCALQDKAGNLWFGTTDNGLYKFDGKTFTRFLEADGLNSNHISCLLEAVDGKIWIGTEAGLCLYDPSTHLGSAQHKSLRAGGKTFAKIQIPLPTDLPPNKNQLYRNSHWVYSMLQAKSGKLWFATIDGVYIYDGQSFTHFVIDEAANSFFGSNDKVERILEDNAGNIWLGGRTNAGVFRYDGKTISNFKLPALTIVNESVRFEKDRIVSHNWAWPQLQDKNGNIWFSNWAGAYRYDGNTFISFTKSNGLSGNGLVAKIIEDKKGIIWLGGDGGLSRYDGKSFTSFQDGLINPWIWAILEDKTGNIWVGTRQTGLYLFDGKGFISYSE